MNAGVYLLLQNTDVHENCPKWALTEQHKNIQESQTFDWEENIPYIPYSSQIAYIPLFQETLLY